MDKSLFASILRDAKIGIDQMTDAEREELWEKLFGWARVRVVAFAPDGAILQPTEQEMSVEISRMGEQFREAIAIAFESSRSGE